MTMRTGLAWLLLSAGCSGAAKSQALAPPESIEGTYAASFGDAFLFTVCGIGGSTIKLEGGPCYQLSGVKPIMGRYTYDVGRFRADCKTLDGSVEVLIDGAFVSARAFEGAFSAQFFGEPCSSGKVTMEWRGPL